MEFQVFSGHLQPILISFEGKVLKDFFTGESLTAAKDYLRDCVTKYDRAIVNCTVCLVIDVREDVKGIQ